MTLLVLAALTPQVASPPPASGHVPPPIVTGSQISSRPSRGFVIVDHDPGGVRCGNAAVTPTATARVVSATAYARPDAPTSYTLNFRIDASGRPLSISDPVEAGWDPRASDLAPALAAWRFAPGVPRGGCSVTFTTRTIPLEIAPIALVHRAIALPHERGPGEAALSKRMLESGAGCFRPAPPRVLNRAFPDFETISQAAGTAAYAMVGFDIDDSGKPRRARILSSEGNAALDRAALKAVQDSRFAGGARTGCSYPYYRRQDAALVAPPAPETASFMPANATCAADAPWTLPPRMNYPEPFRRRAIEGWAVVRYDVAPWGATGNVTALASEPAAAFGRAAVGIVQQAKRPPSAQGATGCVERVVFKLPDGTVTASDGAQRE